MRELFLYRSLLLLGQRASRLGLSTHKEKVDAICDLKEPHNVHELQVFLGMMVYFAAYIPFYAWIVAPLFALLKKGSMWRWTSLEQEAFDLSKEALVSAPVRAYAIPGLGYRLYSDACDVGIACILQQVQPISIKDLKGTKSYDTLKSAFDKKEKIPQLTARISKLYDDVPTTTEWAAEFEDTVVHIEHVIAYWDSNYRICIGKALQQEVIAQVHDILTEGAHAGYHCTYNHLASHYYWPKMNHAIRAYVASCDICQKIKPRRQAPIGLLQPLPNPENHFEVITMDFITELPFSNSFDAILVIVDKLTKYVSQTRSARPTYHNEEPRLSVVRERPRRRPCASASGIAIEIPLHAYLTSRCGVGHPVDGLGNPAALGAHRLYLTHVHCNLSP